MLEQGTFRLSGIDDDLLPITQLAPQVVKFHPPTPRVLTCNAADSSRNEQLRSVVEKYGGTVTAHAQRVATEILAARGYTPRDAEAAFASDVRLLPDPSTMKNFDRAIDLIFTAVVSKVKIGINGDFDVDGTTSVAQALKVLLPVGAAVEWRIPNRFTDGYGLSERLADEFIAARCGLVILFDHGSRNHGTIARLRGAGVQVVVFDHHAVSERLPDAVVVNPAQAGCAFAEHAPCASGLAFFASRRLAQRFGLPEPDTGLAALGTISDMVPLVGANRIIVRSGLEALRNGTCRGIIHLASQLHLQPDALSSADIGFYIGPAINAAGRLSSAEVCVQLMTGDDEAQLKQIARSLVDTNEERKKIQRRQLIGAYERLAKLPRVPRVLVAHHSDHHQGVVGLTAQGLARKHYRPAFVFARADDGTLKGSARAGSLEYDLAQMLSEATRNDMRGVIIKEGGHKAAAGVTIRGDGLPDFVKLISQAAVRQQPNPSATVPVVADTTLTFKALSPSLVQGITQLLDPYGQHFSNPRFLFEAARVVSVATFEGGRRMVVLEQHGRQARAFIGLELWDDSIAPGVVIDLIASPATIYRRDAHHVQLSVEGYRLSDGVAQLPQNIDTPPAEAAPTPQAGVVPADISKLRQPAAYSRRSEASRKSQEPPQYKQLLAAMVAAMNQLPRTFLYRDLESLVYQPFDSPRLSLQLEVTRSKLIGDYKLTALKADAFQVRPEQVEFIRWFLGRTDNAILQAPTGSGKTEVALVIASQQRSLGRRTIFCAPTVEIQLQVSRRAPQMIDVDATPLDGSVSPKKRSKLYKEHDPAFISAIPHVINNDLKSGLFSFRPTDLLIVDEGHHTTGEYPYVPLIEAARSAGARVLLLSATPGQIEPEGAWDKFAKLKQLVGVTHIFPLNVVRKHPEIRPIYRELTGEMKEAQEFLLGSLADFRGIALEYLKRHASKEMIREAESLLGTTEPTSGTIKLKFPSANLLLPYINSVRQMNDDHDRWRVVSSLYAVLELSELYNTLVQQGTSGFLLRVVEKRCELCFPIKASQSSSGRVMLAPKSSLKMVYGSSQVQRAFIRLAQGPFVGIWDRASLAKLAGLSVETWASQTTKERRRSFNHGVKRALAELSSNLASLAYSDHPFEQYIIEQLREEAPDLQTLVFVRDRLPAHFLADRLSYLLSSCRLKAVPLTGSGEQMRHGLSRTERASNLQALAEGRVQIVVTTSAGNEGIDFKQVQRGFACRFSGSPTVALQQWGRVGRHDLRGRVEYLCSTPEAYWKFLSILRKVTAFYRMLNRERQAILDQESSR